MFQCRRQLSGVTQSWSWERGRGGGGGGMKERVKGNDREREHEKPNELDAWESFSYFPRKWRRSSRKEFSLQCTDSSSSNSSRSSTSTSAIKGSSSRSSIFHKQCYFISQWAVIVVTVLLTVVFVAAILYIITVRVGRLVVEVWAGGVIWAKAIVNTGVVLAVIVDCWYKPAVGRILQAAFPSLPTKTP